MKQNLSAVDIHNMAIRCGFENCGIIPLSDLDDYADRLATRRENVPQSDKFYQILEPFTKLKELYPWGKAVIICTSWYGQYKYPESLQGKYAKAFMLDNDTNHDSAEHRGKMRFEEWLADVGLRFEGGEKYAPRRNFPLRLAAVKAGLGIIRKNNFFYSEKGSFYNLEGYIIDQDFVYKENPSVKPCPETCNLCQRACKTQALSAPYTMNPTTCVSFWTTFGQGNVPEGLTEESFSQWVCGCDACQDVCPNNRHDWSVGADFPGIDEITELLQPNNIINASDSELCEKVIPKTADHILPEQVNTLRICAERSLKNHAV